MTDQDRTRRGWNAGHTGDTPGARAQTTLDFAVGAGVFLVAVAFVFAFVPAMFDPFSIGTGSGLAVADRTADSIAGGTLATSTGVPGVLNTTCTVAFFAADPGPEAGCEFDPGDELGELTAVGDRGVNVTITTLNGTPDEPVVIDGTTLARGDPPTAADDVALASRIVLIDDDRYRLVVRVW